MMAWPPGGRHTRTPSFGGPVTPKTPSAKASGTEEEEEHFFEPEAEIPEEEGADSPSDGPWGLLRRLVPWGSKYYDAQDGGAQVCVYVCDACVCMW
jgi:hypothetical protein